MYKEWFSSKELTEIDGLPSTIQGVNRKARAENWVHRKRSGTQGKAVEYHIDSLPTFVRTYLRVQEDAAVYQVDSTIEPARLWMFAFQSLNENEQQKISAWLVKNGVKSLLALIEQQKV